MVRGWLILQAPPSYCVIGASHLILLPTAPWDLSVLEPFECPHGTLRPERAFPLFFGVRGAGAWAGDPWAVRSPESRKEVTL